MARGFVGVKKKCEKFPAIGHLSCKPDTTADTDTDTAIDENSRHIDFTNA